MKIGILETGLRRDWMEPVFKPYPDMFADFLGRAHSGFEFETVSVIRGEVAASTADCDGWLITGSRHGVYEQLDWMAPLMDFIRRLAAREVPLIGVCFGHQIIAQALGGEVIKSERGWGLGLHRYRVERQHTWMPTHPANCDLYAFHQDQVVIQPPNSEVFLSSDFCPYAGLSYGHSIISVQAHPEFETRHETLLLETLGGDGIPSALAHRALDEIRAGARSQGEMLANWFAEFLLSRRQPAAQSA